MTVTAQQGGSTGNGLLLRVMVLTGTAVSQGPAAGAATATQSGTGAKQATVTTTVTGSLVYGALDYANNSPAFTAAAGTTLLDNFQDFSNSEYYSSCRATSATGTPGATTVGASAPSAAGGGAAFLEILPNGTIYEDASAPPVATTTTATSVTTASFTPPDGGVTLVALVASDAGSGVCTMSVSGGGLTWSEAVASNAPNQDYAGVWVATIAPPAPGDPNITATQGGVTAPGMALRVLVLTGALPAASQAGATAQASQGSSFTPQLAITTTQAGSRVYGSLITGNTAYTANASTTLIDNIADAVNSERYGTCKTTALTGTPGAVTVGSTTPTAANGVALLEILTSRSLAEDASAPPVVSTTSAVTVVTAAVTPPPGSLLVAIVSSDGGGGVTTMTVSGGGPAPAREGQSQPPPPDYAGVWIADIPPPRGARHAQSPSLLRPPRTPGPPYSPGPPLAPP